jgi:cytochrome c peroxidase
LKFFSTIVFFSLIILIFFQQNFPIVLNAQEKMLVKGIQLNQRRNSSVVFKEPSFILDGSKNSENDLQKKKLGEKLFHFSWKNDSGLELSCAHCHNKVKLPSKFKHKLQFDPPPLVGTLNQKWLGWAGSHKTNLGAAEKIIAPLFNAQEHNLSLESFNEQLLNFGIKRGVSEFAEAVAAYIESIEINSTEFDDNIENLSAPQMRGLKVFVGKGNCVLCHNGEWMSNQAFHNIGVPLNVENERSSRSIENNMEGKRFGAFRTPCLRCSIGFPPYFHNGAYDTLEEVVNHYNVAPESPAGETELSPLNLSSVEKRDLISFLRIFK